ncbi:trypsin Inhibitor like cysteine rich domain protein, partial [Ancylostoma caninum]
VPTAVVNSTVSPCGKNEVLDECGNECENKCNQEKKICRVRVCFTGLGACACDEGFFRNKKGECVSEDDCEYDNMEFITFPPEETKALNNCSLHEYYDHCGGTLCEPTCEEPDRVCLSRACSGPADCPCDTGYYRNKAGICVTEDECQDDFMEIITFPPETTETPKNCSVHEYYEYCGGTHCEPTCEEPNRVCLSRACFGPADCPCDKGYYRNKAGKCVTEDECQDDFMEIITFDQKR